LSHARAILPARQLEEAALNDHATRSFLTGQPPWPTERSNHPDILHSKEVRGVLRKIAMCDAELRALGQSPPGMDPDEVRQRRAHVLRLSGLMHLALEEALRHQRYLDMARHHAGVGPCSVSAPTLKEDPDRR